jgi:hypothetical protein
MRHDRYDLIVASASRPHLLARTLRSLIEHLDIFPARVIVHDDARFPGKVGAIREAIEPAGQFFGCPVVFRHDEPPIRHGPALAWLLDQARSRYALYSQDDHEAVREIPIVEALQVMERDEKVHQVRFNKRATLGQKDTWRGPWRKREYRRGGHTLTVADHWYFQTGLWRTAVADAIVKGAGRFDAFAYERSVEEAVNRYLDLGLQHQGLDPLDPDARAEQLGTFIWGPIGEDRYVQHIGAAKEDWAGDHERDGGLR